MRGSTDTTPSRITRAVATDIFRSDAKDRSARNSWINPRTPLNSTMARMAAASSQSSKNPERIAAPISTQTMTLVELGEKEPKKGRRRSFRQFVGTVSLEPFLCVVIGQASTEARLEPLR